MPNQVMQEIKDAIQSIRFGSVEITIHDGTVVQIERKEKVRFENKKGKGGDEEKKHS